MIELHLSQKDIYFDYILDSRNPQYNIGTYVVIRGSLNVDLFKESIISSEKVFDIFKFAGFSNNAPSVGLHKSSPAIQITQLDAADKNWSEAALKQWLQERIHEPFDIHSGCLYDFLLIKIKEGEHWFYVGCHHLFSDGYGVPYVFLSYVFDKYHALRTGDKKEFHYPSYLQLIEKSNHYLDSVSYESDRNYWKDRFSSSQEPILQRRSKTVSSKTDSTQLHFSAEAQKKLRSFCLENEISLQDFLIGALTVYYKKTNQINSFDFCLPVHNRNDRKERQTLGVFSKIIPCRIEVENPKLSELFRLIKTNQRHDYRHKQFPVSHFNNMIQSEINNSSRPFDICVNYRYFRLDTTETELDLKGFRNDAAFSKIPVEYSWCDFAEKGNENLFLEITFREDYFTKAEIELLGQRILFIIDQFYHAIDNAIHTIDVLPGEEKQQLLVTFNDTAAEYPKDKTIIDLFEEQAAKTPDCIAVIYEDKKLSYKSLDELSNQLADYLQKNYRTRPDDLIGIRQERSEWMIVSVLGVLKSGAAYVPIDPGYPQERIDYIEKDTNCKVCLDEIELSRFKASQEKYSKNKVSAGISPGNLSQVIYTSGSTGRPKGVMIEHKNTYAFIKWSHAEFAGSAFDTVLFTTSLNFDLSVFEIFHPLTTGKEVKVLKDGLAIPANLDQEKKQLINTVPSVVGALLQQGMGFEPVSVLNMAGEPIPPNYRAALKGKIKEIRNLYGPTEDTTYSTFIRIDKDDRDLIGKPISNTQIYILSEEDNLQPIGVAGEICIGGEGLARGYLNQEELSKEKFVKNPFKAGERLYKTGDLGRWLPDGNIELIGRKDHQVKIRGYRIELGEIENALLNNPAIEEAVVMAKENQNKEKELVAYVVSKEEQNAGDLRSYLKAVLPGYMLPAYYVQLEALPLTSNGKIDRKSLPDPKGLGLTGSAEYVAPGSEIEKQLSKIWQEVLQRENIGVKDDFFALGGHSLKATKLIGEYHKLFDVRLTLPDVFNHSTIESHSALLTGAKKETFVQIKKVAGQANYPISDAQRRLWILSQFENGSVAYNMPGSVRLEGTYDLALFQRAFDSLIERHEILRTVFSEAETGEVRQCILEKEDLGFKIGYKDFSKAQNKEEDIKHYIAEDSRKAFDLENGPLFRAGLLQVEKESYVFYFNMHHIISDGWSVEVLSKDVFAYYEAYKENKKPVLKELQIQYKDYSAWQLAQLNEESFKAHKAYWLDHLKGELPLLNLPATKQRPKLKTYNGYGLGAYISRDASVKLRRYSQENGGSLFMSLLASWNILMYHYTSQTDIVTGTPVAGREHADLEDQIGCYVNMLALRNEVNPELSFNDFYRALKDNTLKSYSHQMYPFDRLVEELNLQRDTGRSVGFDIVLVLQNNGEKIKGIELNKEELSLVRDLGPGTSKFDLDISFREMGDYLSLQVVYNPDVYERDMVEGLVNHYRQLLDALLENPEKKISHINYLSGSEKRDLLYTYNNTAIAYPKDTTIIDLFEEQVTKTPDHVAVAFEENTLSYQQLDELSNQLAHYLKTNYAIAPDDLVGIKLERSAWMIVSMLGVLKSGGAYVPIDPGYPQERIDYIEKDTKCKVCIDEHELSRFRTEQTNYAATKITAAVKPGSLAYVIYTSGSTGQPKGVMIEHGNVVRLFKTDAPLFDFNDKDVWTMFHSYAFDFSVWEMYGALLFGGKLVVVPKLTARDTALYLALLQREGVTVLNQTPSAFYNLSQEDKTGKVQLQIRYVIFGGEALSPGRLQHWHNRYPNCRLINMYGITETTVHTTYKEIGQQEITLNRSNIGKAIPTVSCMVLDENKNLVPVGVAGELYIGGAGLARGYLNRQALTNERFIAHPFAAGERLYKTGDKAKQLANGDFEYLGRIDNQVKIRGHRIELGEIEHALLKNKHIQEAVVIAKDNQNNEKELVAYITAKTEQNISDLKNHLKEILPVYMLPAYYVQLETLPLTANGKVDKKALPDPQGLGLASGMTYVAPKNETEEKLVDIWAEVLGIEKEKIGINDNFFDLGGDSIKVLRLMAGLRKKLGYQLSVADIYNNDTIEKIVVYAADHKKDIDVKNKEREELEKNARHEIEALKERILSAHEISNKENIEDLYPMSDIEKGMVFGYAMNEGTGMYHDQLVSQRHFPQFDIERFKKALDLLTDKHPILRTGFNLSDYECEVQIVYRRIDNACEFKDISDLSHEDQQKTISDYLKSERNRPFVVSDAPLWRMSVFKTGGDDYVFVLQSHHAIIDGWSEASFITELNNLYLQLKEDINYKPALLKSTYKDFIVQQQVNAKDGAAKRFWEQELPGYERLDLFTGEEELGKYSRLYDNSYLKSIEHVAKTLNTTVKVVSLSAYLYMLKVLNYNAEIVTGLVTNTRPAVEDGDKILGCFLNTIPLKVKVDGNVRCSDFILNVNKKLIELKENEGLSTLEMTSISKTEASASNPFFDVLFNYVDFHAYGHIAEDQSNRKNNPTTSNIDVSRDVRTNTFFDFTINTTGGEYGMILSATKKLKSGLTVEYVGELYFKILDFILKDAGALLGDINYLSESEEHKLLLLLNNTTVSYGDKTVMALFEAQAAKTPAAMALQFGGASMTYKELNARSNSLAHVLKEKYLVSNSTKVGVMLERSVESVIAMIGVMKTGACYVPLDHEYPTERVAYIAEDSGLKIILSTEALWEKHVLKKSSLVDITKLDLEKGKKSNPENTNHLDDGAYVIYTSGSTGQPKGVLQTHRMMSNLIQWDIYQSGIATGLKHLQYASFSFDASLHDLYFVLSSGGSAYIVKESSRLDYQALKKEIVSNSIQVVSMPFSALNAFCLETKIESLENHSIQYIISTAEQLYVNQGLKTFLENNPKVELHNHYGPSETHVVTSYMMSAALGNIESRASIGKPVSNSWIYILDQHQNLVPQGVEGELYIGGANLATGYLNKEALTKERFVKDPFKQNSLLYKTGDQGYWRADGNIEFIGRKDDQVKIRGYRIELGEIEQALQKHKDIEEAVVLAKNNHNNEKELVAYIISKKEQNTGELRSYLKELLPAYMLPTHYVQLEAMPLTGNGKIDKKALPDPQGLGLGSGTAYVAPRNEIEEKLVSIWQDVLQKENIGITDDFFALGGHSLKVIKMINQINKQFGLNYDLRGIYIKPTIELIAQQIKADHWREEFKVENESDYTEVKI